MAGYDNRMVIQVGRTTAAPAEAYSRGARVSRPLIGSSPVVPGWKLGSNPPHSPTPSGCAIAPVDVGSKGGHACSVRACLSALRFAGRRTTSESADSPAEMAYGPTKSPQRFGFRAGSFDGTSVSKRGPEMGGREMAVKSCRVGGFGSNMAFSRLDARENVRSGINSPRIHFGSAICLGRLTIQA